MERFPKIPKELTCRTEKMMRDEARRSYYETLVKEDARLLSMEVFGQDVGRGREGVSKGIEE